MIEQASPLQADDLAAWGPWQRVMEDALAACTVQVRELGQALTGERQLTREEFRCGASRLYEHADELVERCEDVERYLQIRREGGPDVC
jgi:hypothetical protein